MHSQHQTMSTTESKQNHDITRKSSASVESKTEGIHTYNMCIHTRIVNRYGDRRSNAYIGVFNVHPSSKSRRFYKPPCLTVTTAELYRRLAEVDSLRASLTHPHDRRKILRALQINEEFSGAPSEVYEQTHTHERMRLDCYVLFVNTQTEVLEARLRARVASMLSRGLLAEVQALYNRLCTNAYATEVQGFAISQAIGFKEFFPLLSTNVPLYRESVTGEWYAHTSQHNITYAHAHMYST
jgi:hypothetical protein